MQEVEVQMQSVSRIPSISNDFVGTYKTLDNTCMKSQCLSNFPSVDHAYISQTGDKHTLTCIPTSVNTPDHLISHQSRNRKSMIIDLIESVFPENIEYIRIDKISRNDHRKTVCKSGDG